MSRGQSYSGGTIPLLTSGEVPQSSAQLLQMLDTLESWIEEAPPQKESQRFGNRAFRRYIQLVEEVCPSSALGSRR